MVCLKDICEKASSSIAQKDLDGLDGQYPVYGASGFIQNVDFYHQDKPYVAVVKDGSVGRVMCLPAYSSITGTMQYILPKAGIDVHYLAYALESLRLERFKTGAIIPHIYFKDYCMERLPKHTTQEQRNISTVLMKIDSLISLRKQQIAKLDELVKARFVELFGDPIENPICWATHPLDTVCNTIVDCPHSTPSYTTENTGFMCIRTSIVKKNKILWDEIEYIPEEEYNKRTQRKKPAKGDIVYTREGAILGIAAIIDRNCNVALGQRSMLLSPNPEKCCSEFLCVAMNFDSFLRKALGGISGSASPHINVGDIKAFDIILPPLDLQHQFAAFVAQTDQQKLTIQHSLAKLELLKKALMQKYFG